MPRTECGDKEKLICICKQLGGITGTYVLASIQRGIYEARGKDNEVQRQRNRKDDHRFFVLELGNGKDHHIGYISRYHSRIIECVQKNQPNLLSSGAHQTVTCNIGTWYLYSYQYSCHQKMTGRLSNN